jgi:phosphotransferase system IIA component
MMLTLICQKLLNFYGEDFSSAIKKAYEIFNGHSLIAYDLEELELKARQDLIPL